MRATAPATLVAHHAYPELRRAVKATLLTGQRAIERAKVRTYWETGWLINEHILNHALLENGHAVRKDAWEFRDWEKEMVG